jgi:hypothetical protein
MFLRNSFSETVVDTAVVWMVGSAWIFGFCSSTEGYKVTFSIPTIANSVWQTDSSNSKTRVPQATTPT